MHPDDWREIDNRVLLGNACHDIVHKLGTQQASPVLREHRQLLLDILN